VASMHAFNIESDVWLQGIYVGEIKSLCEQVEIAARGLNDSIENRQTRQIFFYLRSIVSSCATISQFFWPIRINNVTKRRSEKLRELFSIDDHSMLKDRQFRHHLIHVDERVDQWSTESSNRIMIRQNIGPRNAFGVNSTSAGDLLEHYVLDEHIFIFRGDEFLVQTIVSDVQKIHAKANEIVYHSFESRSLSN
jgi:hypothetical protein